MICRAVLSPDRCARGSKVRAYLELKMKISLFHFFNVLIVFILVVTSSIRKDSIICFLVSLFATQLMAIKSINNLEA